MSRDWFAEENAIRDTDGLLEGLTVSEEERGELLASLIEAHEAVNGARCEKHAPFIFYVDRAKKGHIVQGCCNDWNCARCGLIRAKQEYGRIVSGARKLSDQGVKLYFITLTCRGRELALEEAEKGYMGWTNRLLSTCRANAKKQGIPWVYVQVTERQKRLHPHSHLISSFCPSDATIGQKVTDDGSIREILISPWFVKKNISAGLGRQCEITEIRSPQAVAIYIAKYLFKNAMLTKWPKGWKRIRYSQSWPESDIVKDDADKVAFPLLAQSDWDSVANMGIPLLADSQETAKIANAHGVSRIQVQTEEQAKEYVRYAIDKSY